MKILYVAHNVPYPLDDGLRVHVFHLLKNLASKHEVHLLCYLFSTKAHAYVTMIAPLCASVVMLDHPVPLAPWRRIRSMLLDTDPFCVEQFRSDTMREAIRWKIKEVSPDVVHIDCTPMAQYVDLVPAGVPKVFLPHDALSLMFERNARYERNPARKFYFWNQFRKTRAFEKRMLPRFEKTVVVSPVDQKILQDAAPAASVEWNPLGVDCDFFTPVPDREKKNVVLFRGIMDFFPNHDAALFFAEEVMPLIWSENKDAEFWIAGHNPMPALKKKARADSRIRLLGFVADLRHPMAEATVLVSPMRAGSGMKTKMLEALAMSKAVVATPRSLAGIDIVSGQQALVGTTPRELADQTLDLLSDAALRSRLGEAGRRFVIARHSWSAHADFFERVYRDVVLIAQRSNK